MLDLTTTPPHVTQTLHAGAGATSIRLSPDETLALVCNRTEGSVSVFSVHDKRLAPAGKIDFGAQSGASGVAFTPDGKTAIVSRQFDNQVSVLHIDGTAVTVDKRPSPRAWRPTRWTSRPISPRRRCPTWAAAMATRTRCQWWT